MAHRVAEQYIPQREAVERQLIETLEIPEQAHSVSVSMDRVSIPMEEPRPSQPPASQSAADDCVGDAQGQPMTAEEAPSEVKKSPQTTYSESLSAGLCSDGDTARSQREGAAYDSLWTDAAGGH